MIPASGRDSYWAAVETGSARAAHRVAADLVAAGIPLPTVLDDLVGAAQRRVGELWAENSWSVTKEHAATAVGEHVVQRLREQITAPRTGAHLVVACAEREWHALPALLITARLEHAGHRVTYLGADVSTTALQTALDDLAPRATLVSASLTSSLVFARRHVETSTEVGVPVIVGGTAFDAAGVRAARIGATAHASSPGHVSRLLDELPGSVAPAAPLRADGAREAHAVVAVMSSLVGAVTARVRELGGTEALVVEDHVPHVLGAMAAALLTDDASIVAEARAWLDDVARARRVDRVLVEELWRCAAFQLRDYPLASAALAA